MSPDQIVPLSANMGHNVQRIKLYDVRMILMDTSHADGHNDLGTRSPSTLVQWFESNF